MSTKSMDKVSQESSPLDLHKGEELHPDHVDDYLREGERWATEEDMSVLRHVGDRLP
ncbi:hypothetical protein IWW50_005925, partial [Coemansia erecta]